MPFIYSKPAVVLAALSLLAPLSACESLLGKEVARLPINAVSMPGNDAIKEVSLQLKKDEKIAVWSELDMAYEGEAPLQFQIRLFKDGSPFKELAFDPTVKSVSMNEVRTDVNGSVNWRFSGKNAELTIPEDGTYRFMARLIATPNPTLQLKKAELVLKK